jgi:hypothetical protein
LECDDIRGILLCGECGAGASENQRDCEQRDGRAKSRAIGTMKHRSEMRIRAHFARGAQINVRHFSEIRLGSSQ